MTIHFSARQRPLLPLALSAVLAACGLRNDVVPLVVPAAGSTVAATTEPLAEGQTFAFFGIGVEGAWQAPQFSISLDEYDLARRKGTGDCAHYRHMAARVPGTGRGVRRFGFRVEPGHYAYSGFNGVPIAGPNAFAVPAGKVSYLGDFILATDGKHVERRVDAAVVQALAADVPGAAGRIVVATGSSVPAPGVFLCMP